MATNCVVWEWQEGASLWYPYIAKVSRFIEEKYEETPRPSVINLGDVDHSMGCYDVNFLANTQTRIDTGTMRGIRRALLPLDSPFANGVIWEWLGDYHWSPFDVQTACDLEKAKNMNHPMLDLSSTLLGIPNIVDFQKMEQINKHTGFKRRVQQRTDTTVLYPRIKTASSLGASSPAKHSPVKTRTSTKSSNQPGSSSTAHRASTSTSSYNANAGDSSKIYNPSKKMKASEHPLIQNFTTCITNPPNEECVICFENLSEESGFSQAAAAAASSTPEVKQLSKCKHYFHKACLLELLKTVSKKGGLQCPTCKTIHGTKQGIQPTDGSMDVRTSTQSVPGYPGCGVITIVYHFRQGIQGPEHPNPGMPYHVVGFPRTCYLPDNDRGKKVLRLLKKAWERRLTFTIATSVTMGIEDVVVWNEIHHKTEAFSNLTGHGYPDPNYLDNVEAELASQGVTDDDNPGTETTV